MSTPREKTAAPPTVTLLDHRDPEVAGEIYRLQQTSYAVERDLIGAPDFPPLRVTARDIQREPDTFLGVWEGGRLAGVVSFTVTPALLDIGRMIVHPDRFRRGIAGALLRAAERHAAPGARLTVSTAEKNHPAVLLYRKHGFALTERTVLPDGLVLVRLSRDTGA